MDVVEGTVLRNVGVGWSVGTVSPRGVGGVCGGDAVVLRGVGMACVVGAVLCTVGVGCSVGTGAPRGVSVACGGGAALLRGVGIACGAGAGWPGGTGCPKGPCRRTG